MRSGWRSWWWSLPSYSWTGTNPSTTDPQQRLSLRDFAKQVEAEATLYLAEAVRTHPRRGHDVSEFACDAIAAFILSRTIDTIEYPLECPDCGGTGRISHKEE
jgi:hypothetical protein